MRAHEVMDNGAFRGEEVADALSGPPAVSLDELLIVPCVAVDAAGGGGSICP